MKTSAVVPVRGRLFGARDAAAYLGITTSKVRKLIARGDLVAVRTAAGRLEGVYERDCDAWITKHRPEPEPALRPGQVAVDELMEKLMPPPSERVFG